MNAARQQRAGSAPLLSLGALAASSLLLGCAAHAPSSTGTATASSFSQAAGASLPSATTSSSELDRIRRAERHELGRSSERRAHELRETLDASWEQGQALWLAGDSEAAFDAFDRGVQAVLTAKLDLEAHPELRHRIDAVLGGIHQLAVEDSFRAEGDAVAESAPALPDLESEQDGAENESAIRRVAEQAPRSPRSTETMPSWLAAATGEYTIPMEDASAVDSMVRFYTEQKKDQLELGFARIGHYGPTIHRIFQEEGVPADLMWLSVVESNVNPQAYSRAHAKGLWQFIPGTGKQYGLDLDFWVDERADFEKATRSSARYLKYLHARFGGWHLALAAYNAGEGKVGRGIRATGRPDYWHLRRTRYLRSETKSYVPAMLAVMRIARDPEAYGVRLAPAEPLEWETTRISACAELSVLANCAGTTPETLKQLNPELRRGCTPGDAKNYALRVPRGSRETFETRFAQLPPEQRLSWARHRVSSGDTLTTIASRYGSSVSGIMAANKLKSPHRIGVGWNLLIPRGAAAQALPASAIASHAPAAAGAASVSASKSSTSSTATNRSYRVRSGDTLARIARAHGTSTQSLQQANGLRDANRIRPGQRLLISAPVATKKSAPATYTVRRGDTLSSIADGHGTNVAELRQWNRLPSRGYIHPGQTLRVRADQTVTYAVRKGDTLTRIAQAYRTTVAQLKEWNDLSRSGLIHPGDRLTIFTD